MPCEREANHYASKYRVQLKVNHLKDGDYTKEINAKDIRHWNVLNEKEDRYHANLDTLEAHYKKELEDATQLIGRHEKEKDRMRL